MKKRGKKLFVGADVNLHFKDSQFGKNMAIYIQLASIYSHRGMACCTSNDCLTPSNFHWLDSASCFEILFGLHVASSAPSLDAHIESIFWLAFRL